MRVRQGELRFGCMTLSTLTKHEAKTRSDLLEVQRYDIDVDMTGLLEGEVWRSTSTIAFTCSEPGATTFVDVAMDVRPRDPQR